MFITKTVTESASVEVPEMTLDQYMVESACEAYEDLLSFNEALAHFDIKEQELIHTESTELDSFREDAMGKAKQFLKDLVNKIKAKWNQFINMVLKKLTTFIANKNKKTAEDIKGIGANELIAVIDAAGAKIKYFEKINSVDKVISDVVDFGDAAFKLIDRASLEDLNNYKPSEKFNEEFGKPVAKDVKGKEVWEAFQESTKAEAAIKKFQKTLEIAIENAGKASSGDEKEAARKVVLINLKGQQVIKLVLASIISTAGSTSYVLGMAAVRYAKNFKKSDKK
jgi:hypothetical protein